MGHVSGTVSPGMPAPKALFGKKKLGNVSDSKKKICARCVAEISGRTSGIPDPSGPSQVGP